MLELDVTAPEMYDEETKKFVLEKRRVRLEHSLVTVSKWESFWEVAFLGDKPKTPEQTVSYIRMMIVGDEPPPEIFQSLVEHHIEEIQKYIGAKMTATTVPELNETPGRKETITSELIYYWMISMQVPVEFEHWHLNRLIMLIRVIGFKNKPKSKQPRMTLAQRRALNEERLAKYNTRG